MRAKLRSLTTRVKDRLGIARTWQYRQATVFYRPDLDGGGRDVASLFVDFIRTRVPAITGLNATTTPFASAFEWCAGPGFIGFAVRAAGLCERLCLADINPAAEPFVRKTIRANRFDRSVEFFVSDNLKNVPARQFDLVVSNPPNYFGLNPAHPFYERYNHDLRPNDRGWHIHRAFYSQIGAYLADGAVLLILEINSSHAEVRTPGFAVPYDIRPRPAIDDFTDMISAAGLDYKGTFPLCTLPGGFHAEIVVSAKPHGR